MVLITKIKDASHLSHYRPISLCNVVYKIASKMVTNWLKQVLPGVIQNLKASLFRVGLSLIM